MIKAYTTNREVWLFHNRLTTFPIWYLHRLISYSRQSNTLIICPIYFKLSQFSLSFFYFCLYTNEPITRVGFPFSLINMDDSSNINMYKSSEVLHILNIQNQVFNSYTAVRLLARYCYSAMCTRACYRLKATFMLASHHYGASCALARRCNNSYCSCPLHRVEWFCSAIESTVACIRLSALDYASLYTTVRLDFLE